MNFRASERRIDLGETSTAPSRLRFGPSGPDPVAVPPEDSRESKNDPERPLQPRIEASVRYMMRNLDKPVSVSTLSAIAELSPSTFFLSFKRATGHPPITFLIRARMTQAMRLLEETDLQIKQIAALVGYEDEFHFSRRFKSVIGLAPRHYRDRTMQNRSPGGASAEATRA